MCGSMDARMFYLGPGFLRENIERREILMVFRKSSFKCVHSPYKKRLYLIFFCAKTKCLGTYKLQVEGLFNILPKNKQNISGNND